MDTSFNSARSLSSLSHWSDTSSAAHENIAELIKQFPLLAAEITELANNVHSSQDTCKPSFWQILKSGAFSKCPKLFKQAFTNCQMNPNDQLEFLQSIHHGCVGFSNDIIGVILDLLPSKIVANKENGQALYKCINEGDFDIFCALSNETLSILANVLKQLDTNKLGWNNGEKLHLHNNHVQIFNPIELNIIAHDEMAQAHAIALKALQETNKLLPLEHSYTWRMANGMPPLDNDLSAIPTQIANLHGDEYLIALAHHAIQSKAGNCEAMAVVCAFLLARDGFEGSISKIVYVDHALLILNITLKHGGELFVDPWSQKVFSDQGEIKGYYQAANHMDEVAIGKQHNVTVNHGPNIINWQQGKSEYGFGHPFHRLINKKKDWFDANFERIF